MSLIAVSSLTLHRVLAETIQLGWKRGRPLAAPWLVLK